MARIVVQNGDYSGTELLLDEFRELLMGRHADCQLSNVFKDIPGVSRRHARVSSDGANYVLEDLGSRNGTLHNGRALAAPSVLRSGDQFTIGGVCMLFVEEEASSRNLEFSTGASLYEAGSICSTINVSRRVEKTDVVLDAPRKFQALVDMLAKMGDSLDTDAVLEGLLDGLLDIFENTQHGFVALRESPEADSVSPRVVRQRNTRVHQEVRISQTIVNRVMSGKTAILSRNAATDERFQHNQSVLSHGISSLMCTPLVNRSGDCLGVIQLETNDTTPFTTGDLEVLASVTPHAAIAVDYARVHAEALQRQAMQRDLTFARQIQRNFLPRRQPQFESYRFFSYYEAAYQVGGDYYDYLELPEGRLGVVVADVAGKGIAAGLIMSKFSGEFKYMLSREESLTAAVAGMNDSLLEETGMRFITVAAIILDYRNHSVEIVNAGHSDSLLRQANGEVVFIDEDVKGTPIGMFPGQQYCSKTIQLQQGDTLLMFTDGLTEATAADNSLYGVDRIVRQVGSKQAGPEELGTELLNDVRRFVGDHPQSDDMCLVCMQRIQ